MVRIRGLAFKCAWLRRVLRRMERRQTTMRACVVERNVRQPPVSSATHPTANVHLSPFQIVSRQMAQQLMERLAHAESQNVQQPLVFTATPLVFTAPPPPAPVPVVILARALVGPHSTQEPIALAGQRHVIRLMACSATHPTANVHL